MDFLFGGGVGQTSSSLATASSSIQNDESISRIPTTAAATTTSTTATATTASATTAAATHSAAHGNAAVAAATSAHFNGHDNGPILYDNLNRTSAIDDIRSVVIYIFIITIFLSFFLILPGIRNGKFPTFLCIITSLLVTSIIVISLNGTTWHVGEAPISAPYKAFSRDRIQGDLGVRIGLQSVNISLKAHKYYILHATDGPMIMENTHKYSLLHQPLMVVMAPVPSTSGSFVNQQQDRQSIKGGGDGGGAGGHSWVAPPSSLSGDENLNNGQSISAAASTFINQHQNQEHQQQTSANDRSNDATNSSLAEELLTGRTSDGGVSVDTELEVDEPFAADNSPVVSGSDDNLDVPVVGTRRVVRADQSPATKTTKKNRTNVRNKRHQAFVSRKDGSSVSPPHQSQYTIKRVYVDINYNERFYWIEPLQMRREYQQALERGLPYPILTVVEYLSQDDAGFNWSRQYRVAGYYTSMLLWLSVSVCILMFCLHCAAPKYGIYAMQALGVLLLLTNLNYATLVPRGDQKLVIPFEGQSLTFRFGWNFWLVLVGGCLSLLVGTIIVIIDQLFPNFIFTTVLDVDFDSTSQKTYYEKKYKILGRKRYHEEDEDDTDDLHGKTVAIHKKPEMPPFMRELKRRTKDKRSNTDKQSMLKLDSEKETVNSAIGVKLSPAYLSDTASGNATMNQHDSLTERNQTLLKATEDDEPLQSKPKLRTNEKPVMQDEERMITSREQTIRL